MVIDRFRFLFSILDACYTLSINSSFIFDHMNKFITICIILGSLFFVNGVQGQTSEQILSYDVDLYVYQEGYVRVTEKILYDFGTQERRGIIREIPLTYINDSGATVNFGFELVSVTNEYGKSYKVLESGSSYKTIRVGDPDIYLTGQHWYSITYVIDGALAQHETHTELYWNAIGNNWSIPIQQGVVQVTIPVGADIVDAQAICYTGAYQSLTSLCSSDIVDSQSFVFSLTHPLDAYEGLTIVAGWTNGVVRVPTEVTIDSEPTARLTIDDVLRGSTPLTLRISEGEHEISLEAFKYLPLSTTITLEEGVSQTFTYALQKSWIGYFVEYILPLLLLLGVSGGLIRRWFQKGRDPKGRGTVIVQYESPQGMTPGEVGVVYDEKAHMHDISASIVHLATQGYLTIKRIDEQKKRWFGSNAPKFSLLKKKQPTVDNEYITKFEVELWEDIFQSKNEVTLASLENTFYTKLPSLKQTLIDRMVERGYYEKDPIKTRNTWIASAIGFMIIGGFASFVCMGIFEAWLFMPVHIVNTLVFFIVATVMHRRTAEGARVYEEVLGLREFIKVTTQDRIKALYSPHNFQDLFEKLLPYAMVFGLEKEWGEHFEGLFDTPPQWYEGTGSFSPVQFSGLMHAFNTTSQQTLASAPSSSGSSSGGWSGGSGFSSSGGFSGGGFGGGGGSSW